MPVMPQNAAGWRIDPPVSVPVAAGVKHAATAAALPPDEPPELPPDEPPELPPDEPPELPPDEPAPR